MWKIDLPCRKGYEVTILSSAAGYYIGTRDKEGFPNCRLSSGYAKTVAEARENLNADRQRAEENAFCNGCGCCFKSRFKEVE